MKLTAKSFETNMAFPGASPVMMKIRVFIDEKSETVVGIRSVNFYDMDRQVKIKRYDNGTEEFADADLPAMA